MGTYASPDDVRAVLARDSSVKGTGADLEDGQLEQAIEQAEAQVDAMLNVRYRVPFTPATLPPIVRSLTIDIAAYLADLTYRGHKDYATELDPIFLRYRRAQEMLLALNNGTATIDIEGETDDASFAPILVNQSPKMIYMDDLGLGPEPWSNREASYNPDWYRT